MSLHDELWAQYVVQPKVRGREYDDFLLEEIARLRAELAVAQGQNERIKQCWRMCGVCSFVWADPKEARQKCPQCDWNEQAAKLNAAHEALGLLAKDLLSQLDEATRR